MAVDFDYIQSLRRGTDREILGVAVQTGDEWFVDSCSICIFTWYRAVARAVAPVYILELGVRYGYSGMAMLQGAKDAGVLPVTYVGIDAEMDGVASNDIAIANLTRIEDVVIQIIKSNTNNVVGTSAFLFELGHRYDLIHVDGDHSVDGVRCELALAEKWVRSGGTILIDDIDADNVRIMADTFCKVRNFSPIVIPTYHGMYMVRMP